MLPKSFFVSLFLLHAVTGSILNDVFRIVNGDDAKPGEIPFQVSLQYNVVFQQFCGGSILNKDYVLTAAHCVHRVWIRDILVIVGTTDLDKPRAIHNATEIKTHENYTKPAHFANDIALIKVDPPIEFNQFVRPAILPEEHLKIPEGQLVQVSGFGRIDTTQSSISKTLKKVRVNVISQKECNSLYEVVKKPIYPEQICTLQVKSPRRGTCVSDSGGPLTMNGVLVGIVSWSLKYNSQCAHPKFPDVFVRVPEYVKWIKKNAHLPCTKQVIA